MLFVGISFNVSRERDDINVEIRMIVTALVVSIISMILCIMRIRN